MSKASGYVPQWVCDDLFNKSRRRLLNHLTTPQAFQYAVKHFGDDAPFIESRYLVWQTFLHKSHSLEFVDKIPSITNAEEAAEMYASHLLVEPCFESLARAIRDLRTQHGMSFQSEAPANSWYSEYLSTSHWAGLKLAVRDHYRSCVLCGQDEGKLNTHHKHYKTLGNESLFDLSLLCDGCHDGSHQFLGLRVPRVMPRAVLQVLKTEGVKWLVTG